MIDLLNSNDVAIHHVSNSDYLDISPYHPDKCYPEYFFNKKFISSQTNVAYEAVRNILYMLGYDNENYEKKEWNPLGEIIKPNNKVVLKPNFVLDRHEEGGELYSIITHPSILRALCDYVYLALDGKGEIIIADAPNANCDFNHLMRQTKLREIQELYQTEKKFKIQIYDIRQLRLVDYYDSSTRVIEDGDPLGYSIVDLGSKSLFSGLKNIQKIYGADYDRKEIVSHHNAKKNEYCIANTILSADVVISVPKMKTHRKAGVTLCLKNMVGINGNKNYLPHFRIGLPEDGGDEFPTLNKEQKVVMYTDRKLKDALLSKQKKTYDKLYQFARKIYHIVIKIQPTASARDIIECGDWHGNDTIWRMILDLNRILIYADSNGKMHNNPQRKLFMLVDGIWAGEKQGPLKPEVKKTGVVVGGVNPLVTDIVVTQYMGIDIDKIPKLQYGMELKEQKLSNINFNNINIIESNKEGIQKSKFKLPIGWESIIK